MLAKLAKIANRLDHLGLTREADSLDKIIRKIAGELLDDSDLHEEFEGIPVQDPDYPEEEVDEYGSDEEVDEEESDITEKHFGFSLDGIGDKIGKVLELWDPDDLFYNRLEPISEVLIRTIGDPNFKYLGAGSFRMVFSYGNDYVIKIAAPGGFFNQALKMNKEDATFGRMPKYSNLFPKVYETDAAYKWIIMERCSVIDNENKFLEFFPNPVTDPFVNPFARIELFSYALRSCVYKETKSEAEIAGHTDYLVNQLKDKMGIRPEDIIGAYERLTLFNKIVDFCKEFSALPREIRIGNVGISSDGRFVIIDSSVEGTINDAIF